MTVSSRPMIQCRVRPPCHNHCLSSFFFFFSPSISSTLHVSFHLLPHPFLTLLPPNLGDVWLFWFTPYCGLVSFLRWKHRALLLNMCMRVYVSSVLFVPVCACIYVCLTVWMLAHAWSWWHLIECVCVLQVYMFVDLCCMCSMFVCVCVC